MNIEVKITIEAATFRGLVVDSLRRGQTVAQRISDIVSEYTPPLEHRKSGDRAREALEQLPPHLIDQIKRSGARKKLDVRSSLASFMIRRARQFSGISIVKN